MRRLAVALSTAALAALLALTTLPAHADPALSIDNLNGRRTVRVEHPDNPGCYATVTIDQHLGFAATGDTGPEFASPVAWVSDGPCVKRFQVDNLRLRVDQDSVLADLLVNDFFPAKQSNPRNNTAVNCLTQTTNAAGTLTTRNLYDERAPQDGECETADDRVKNPLNNVFDYDPDTSLVKAYADWTPISGSGVIVSRVFLTIQWDAAPGVANWEITRHTVLSGVAAYGN